MADYTQSIEVLDTKFIWADFDRNVRHAWKYKVEPKENFDPAKDLPGFFEDVFYNGVKVNIEVSELTEKQIDAIMRKHPELTVRPKYRVVRGNRRWKAVLLAKSMVADIFQTLTCVVYRGLSESDEIKLMCDHTGIEKLDDFEVFTSVERLNGTDLTQAEIGHHVGKTRAWTQDRIYLIDIIRDIPEIRVAYEEKFRPKAVPFKNGYVPFTWEDVDVMHKAQSADQAAGIKVDHPDSTLAKEWRRLSEQKDSPTKDKKAMTRKELDKKEGHIKGREVLELAHSFYNGDGGNILDAVELYDSLVATAALVPGLKAEVDAHLSTIAAKDAIIADLNAHLADREESLTAARTNAVEAATRIADLERIVGELEAAKATKPAKAAK